MEFSFDNIKQLLLLPLYRKGIGLMIVRKEKGYIIMWKEPNMKENGLKINSTDKVQKYGLTKPVTLANIFKGRRREKENLFGVMVLHMKAISRITISKEMANMSGQT